jgi:hypothetical protein
MIGTFSRSGMQYAASTVDLSLEVQADDVVTQADEARKKRIVDSMVLLGWLANGSHW